jgi:hypothetical protein
MRFYRGFSIFPVKTGPQLQPQVRNIAGWFLVGSWSVIPRSQAKF